MTPARFHRDVPVLNALNIICSSLVWEMFCFKSGDYCLKLSPPHHIAGARWASFSRHSAAMEGSLESQRG